MYYIFFKCRGKKLNNIFADSFLNDKYIKDKTTKKIPNEKDADTAILEKELSLKLGVKLTINDKNNKGSIKIQYRNIDQRENIIKKLTGGS